MKAARIQALILFSAWMALLPVSLCGQQPAAPAAEAAPIAEARAAYIKAQAEHPGNTLELAKALDDLVSAQLDAETPNDETMSLANRALAVSLAASGPRGKAYTTALGFMSEVYIALSQPARARPFAEQDFEIAQKDFPDTKEGSDSADELAYACQELGDYKCSLHADEVAVAEERKYGGNDN